MACSSQSMLSANSYSFLNNQRILRKQKRFNGNSKFFSVNASSSGTEEECNVEECAPEKEVGKLSIEWLAEDKTKVSGTFPPKKKGWTGYVEKDTAGQTNIYSVEPAVYVAESAISSGAAGTSSAGAENTAGLAAILALIAVAAASSILLQVDKNAPEIQTVQYSGPPLSYYISKFKPAIVVEAVTVVAEPQTAPPVEEATITSEASEASVSSEASEASVSTEIVPEVKEREGDQSSSVDNVVY